MRVARQVVVTTVDDLDDSVEATATVTFTLDGRSYEIDLGAQNEARFRAALAPYIAAARKARRTSNPSKRPSQAPGKLREVRAWARGNGFNVSTRGRVSQEVIEAYERDHSV